MNSRARQALQSLRYSAGAQKKGQMMTEAAVAEFSKVDFRQAMGNFCTGVTVVTGIDNGEPVGLQLNPLFRYR